MRRASWKLMLTGIGLLLVMTSSAFATIALPAMNFEGGYVGPISSGGTYSQNGMTVTVYNVSGAAATGDPLLSGTGNWLYFDGSPAYAEFRLTSGGSFNLISFDFLTNGYYGHDRWIETSSGQNIVLGAPETPTTISYSGDSRFQNLTWFQIGTGLNATQVDNVTFQAVPIPAAIWLLGSGLVGLAAIRRRFKK